MFGNKNPAFGAGLLIVVWWKYHRGCCNFLNGRIALPVVCGVDP